MDARGIVYQAPIRRAACDSCGEEAIHPDDTRRAHVWVELCIKLLFAALFVIHVVRKPSTATILIALWYGPLAVGQVCALIRRVEKKCT